MRKQFFALISHWEIAWGDEKRVFFVVFCVAARGVLRTRVIFTTTQLIFSICKGYSQRSGRYPAMFVTMFGKKRMHNKNETKKRKKKQNGAE